MKNIIIKNKYVLGILILTLLGIFSVTVNASAELKVTSGKTSYYNADAQCKTEYGSDWSFATISDSDENYMQQNFRSGSFYIKNTPSNKSPFSGDVCSVELPPKNPNSWPEPHKGALVEINNGRGNMCYTDVPKPDYYGAVCRGTDTPDPVTLSGTISVNPTSVNACGYLNWSASATGGTGSYTYSWSGTDGLSGSSYAVSKSYCNTGTKTGTVTITSGSQQITLNATAVVNSTDSNLSVSCSADDSNIEIDEDVTWRSTASGGTGSYTYSWSGTNSLSGNSRNLTWSYDTDGTKRATVTVTSGNQTVSASCTTRVEDEEEDDDLEVSCYASQSSVQTGSQVRWYVNVSGGDGDYRYSWSGTDSLNSSSKSPSKIYNTAGRKSATVTVRDGDGQRQSDTCYVNVNSVLAYTESYQTPIAPAVYLSQVPYTGFADNMKLYFFIGLLGLFSAWIAYIIVSYQKGY